MAKHLLIWMAITKGQCACGKTYDLGDAQDMTDMEATDEILDMHNDHKKARKQAGW